MLTPYFIDQIANVKSTGMANTQLSSKDAPGH